MKIIKTIVKKRCGVCEAVFSLRTHDNTNQSHIVPSGGCNQGVSGSFCVACLSGKNAFIMGIPLCDKSIGIRQVSGRSGHVSRRNGISRSTGNLTEILICYCGSQNFCQIMGSGIVIRIRKAIGIHKMGVFASQFCGTFIHHGCKITYRTSYPDSHLGTDFIGRSKHNGIETLFYRKLFSNLGINGRVAWF